MNSYVKSVDNLKTKLLYLMGATWHNSCMFDLKSEEPNFSDLLNSHGIETHTFNIVGTGPEAKTGIIGNAHEANIQQALDMINQHQIEYVLGYSYGAMLVSDMFANLPSCVKGIVLLDPYAVLNVENNVFIDNFDKKIVSRERVAEDLKNLGSTINNSMQAAHLLALSDSETLITATYPGKTMKAGFERFTAQENINKFTAGNIKFLAVFSKNANPKVASKFPKDSTKIYADASHWLLLEKERFDFANDVANFIDKN
jgi:pimeloyl-ACP methyl ester carboxylesterase